MRIVLLLISSLFGTTVYAQPGPPGGGTVSKPMAKVASVDTIYYHRISDNSIWKQQAEMDFMVANLNPDKEYKLEFWFSFVKRGFPFDLGDTQTFNSGWMTAAEMQQTTWFWDLTYFVTADTPCWLVCDAVAVEVILYEEFLAYGGRIVFSHNSVLGGSDPTWQEYHEVVDP